MDSELIEEICYEIQLLLKTGFYNDEEIVEIIDDEFIEENLRKNQILKLFEETKSGFDTLSEDSEAGKSAPFHSFTISAYVRP